MTTPAESPTRSAQNFDLDGRLTELGKLEATVRESVRGDSEIPLRLAFRNSPRQKWQELAQLVSYSGGFSGDVSGVVPSDPAATKEPFHLQYQYSKANYLERTANHSQMPVPLPTMNLPEIAEKRIKAGKSIELGSLTQVTLHMKVDLPKGYVPSDPIPVALSRDYADYKSSYTVKDSTITVERTLLLHVRRLPSSRAEDYAAFRKAILADEDQQISVAAPKMTALAIPGDAKAEDLHTAGLAALKAGDSEQAVELFKRVVELEPKHRWAWNNLGRAYLQLNNLEDAIADFRKQIEVNPFDEYAYNNLGRALEGQHKYPEAEQAYRKQLEINPLDTWAHKNLGELLQRQKKYSQAVQELEAAVSIRPDDPVIRSMLGSSYLHTGQTEKGLAAFDKALQIAPSPVIWNNVAYELSENGSNLDRAQLYAESAVTSTEARLRSTTLSSLRAQDLALVNLLGASWDTLGWVCFKKGDLSRAEKYTFASWFLTQSSSVSDHLGQIYEKQGRKPQAIHAYALALAAPHSSEETRGRLIALLQANSKPDGLIQKAREELSHLRTFKLDTPATQPGTAEFFVLLSPESKKPEVKFISGQEELRALEDAVAAIDYSLTLPDANPTKVVRRGILSCRGILSRPSKTSCSFVLLTPDGVLSIN